MSPKLVKSAQSVQEALDKAGLICEVLILPTSTRTANDAASSIGCTIGQIVKSLIFKTQPDEQPVLVLASGANQVHEKQIAAYVGRNIIKADAAFAKKATGFAIGGIPPIGHLMAIQCIFIDQDLMLFDEVWAAAGTPNAVFCVKSQALANMTGGNIVSIASNGVISND